MRKFVRVLIAALLVQILFGIGVTLEAGYEGRGGESQKIWLRISPHQSAPPAISRRFYDATMTIQGVQAKDRIEIGSGCH